MPRLVGLDAGPLAALFIPDDRYHARATQFIAALDGWPFTTAPIITEVMHVLDFSTTNQLRFLSWLRRKGLEIFDLRDAQWDRIAQLLEKYADLTPDFGDLSLIAACEHLETRLIATIDSDFQVYRYKNRQRFENLFPV